MQHFIDGDKNNVLTEPSSHDNSPWSTSSNISENDDMGGTDFGVADASSWGDDKASDGRTIGLSIDPLHLVYILQSS